MFRNRYVPVLFTEFGGRPQVDFKFLASCRRNSQKPNEELIQRFQKNFSDVVSPSSSMNAATALGGNPQLPMGHHVPSSKYVLPYHIL